MRLLLVAVFAIAAVSANAADSLKVTVGHMCCGACKASATAGLKKVDWIDTVSIDGDSITVAPKAGQKIELISLTEALNKCGFPANNITTSGPVTMTLAHLCCGGCVSGFKEKVANLRSQTLDKENVKVDLNTKTVVLVPQAGKELNVAQLIRQIQNAGVYPSACSLSAATTTASR